MSPNDWRLLRVRRTDLLKLLFHSVVLVTLAAPLFLAWSLWRILTGVATLPHHVYQMGDDLVFHFYQRVFLILIEDIVDCKVTGTFIKAEPPIRLCGAA